MFDGCWRRNCRDTTGTNLITCLVAELLILGTATSPALAEGDYGEARTMSSNRR
jgi:hypothetical protein